MYYKIRNYLRNFWKFNVMAWKYYSWDSTFSIEVFVELLEDNARACRDGFHANGEKWYRRGMAMAGFLRKAYLEQYRYPGLKYLFDKNPIKFENGTMTHDYKTDPAMYDRLFEVGYYKEQAIEKELKRTAWLYVNKYIEHLYD